MIDVFWNLYQQTQIAQLKAVARARTSAEAESSIASREASRQLQELDERLDRAVMVVHAMWTLVAERTGLTNEDLARRVTEIDGRDGSVDGRITVQPVKCSCGATVCTKFRRCLFCGKDYAPGNPLGSL
jgi:hypothetical protein